MAKKSKKVTKEISKTGFKTLESCKPKSEKWRGKVCNYDPLIIMRFIQSSYSFPAICFYFNFVFPSISLFLLPSTSSSMDKLFLPPFFLRATSHPPCAILFPDFASYFHSNFSWPCPLLSLQLFLTLPLTFTSFFRGVALFVVVCKVCLLIVWWKKKHTTSFWITKNEKKKVVIF